MCSRGVHLGGHAGKVAEARPKGDVAQASEPTKYSVYPAFATAGKRESVLGSPGDNDTNFGSWAYRVLFRGIRPGYRADRPCGKQSRPGQDVLFRGIRHP